MDEAKPFPPGEGPYNPHVSDGAACAHLTVFWTTQSYFGRTRGWWECADCRTEFVPKPKPKKEQ